MALFLLPWSRGFCFKNHSTSITTNRAQFEFHSKGFGALSRLGKWAGFLAFNSLLNLLVGGLGAVYFKKQWLHRFQTAGLVSGLFANSRGVALVILAPFSQSLEAIDGFCLSDELNLLECFGFFVSPTGLVFAPFVSASGTRHGLSIFRIVFSWFKKQHSPKQAAAIIRYWAQAHWLYTCGCRAVLIWCALWLAGSWAKRLLYVIFDDFVLSWIM